MKRIIVLTLSLGLALFSSCSLCEDISMIDGYYASDEFWDTEGFQDYTDYCKYYYTKESGIKFIESPYFAEVKAEDIRKISSYFYDFKKWMKAGGRLYQYDFDICSITEGDYVAIETKEGSKIGQGPGTYGKFDNYTIWFYDMETHTLFYIHSNN